MKAVLVFFLFGLASAQSQLKECGKTPIPPDETRIVGGHVAKPYSWPWQAEICVDYGNGICHLFCGGSIVDKNWIVSAGHCANGFAPKYFRIKVGVSNHSDLNEPGEVIFNVSQVHAHPKFGSPLDWSNDISLFKVVGDIQFTDHIQPVCIPKDVSNLVHKGKTAYVTGWGTVGESDPLSYSLKQVIVPFLDQSECVKEYGADNIDDTMECAGREGVDSCQGDSGGPMVTKHADGRWFQAGVISFGQGCGEKGYAGVYSRTSTACDFLSRLIGYEICQ